MDIQTWLESLSVDFDQVRLPGYLHVNIVGIT